MLQQVLLISAKGRGNGYLLNSTGPMGFAVDGSVFRSLHLLKVPENGFTWQPDPRTSSLLPGGFTGPTQTPSQPSFVRKSARDEVSGAVPMWRKNSGAKPLDHINRRVFGLLCCTLTLLTGTQNPSGIPSNDFVTCSPASQLCFLFFGRCSKGRQLGSVCAKRLLCTAFTTCQTKRSGRL